MYCRRSRRTAFTLVEVIAGLVLLSTLLVAILTAHGRHAQQIRTAQVRLDAISVADNLMAEWNSQGQTGAPAKEGRINGRLDLTWRWQMRESPELRPFGAAIGRLEIISAKGEALTSIDVLTSGAFGTPLMQASQFR